MSDLAGLAAREALITPNDRAIEFRIIGLCGAAGVGKSTLAKRLCTKYNLVEIPLADFLKRVLYNSGFPEEFLWGPSELRDTPIESLSNITARKALLDLGDLYRTWDINFVPKITLQIVDRIKKDNSLSYERTKGIVQSKSVVQGVVISDVRYTNELNLIGSFYAESKIYRLNRINFIPKQKLHLSENSYQSFASPPAVIDLYLPPINELDSFLLTL